MTSSKHIGPLLLAYVLASRAIPFAAPYVLKRRLERGKELPDRCREKLGEPSLPRPEGRLVWLHAVGLGEVMALRGLIVAMARRAPDLEFLVTSSTRTSAELFAVNQPRRTRHQFLPLDAPRYLRRFLDHWRPDLSIWAEQDLWPGAVVAVARRGIPLALVNARMNADAFARRKRWRKLYADLFARFGLIGAQDEATAEHLRALGASGVEVTGSIKSASPVLACDPVRLAGLRSAVSGRKVWLAASTHAEDEQVAVAAQAELWQADPSWLLILVPRLPERREAILEGLPAGLPVTVGSRGEGPGQAIHLADAFGELGLWYRLAPVALMGGTFGPVEGHNPWEPAALGAAVLHGPRVANFAYDYEMLDRAGAAQGVTPETLVRSLIALDGSSMGGMGGMGAKGKAIAEAARGSLGPLAARLTRLLKAPA